MHCSLHRIAPFFLLVVPLLLTACQVPLPYVPPSFIEAVAVAEVTATSMPAAQEENGIESANVANSTTEEADAGTPEVIDTSTVAEDSVAEETDAEDAEPVDASSGEAAPAEAGVEDSVADEPVSDSQPMATIRTPSLRVRSGPGTSYDILGGASEGETFAVIGEENGCEWLNIAHPTLDGAWISGLPEYTSMSTQCDQVGIAVAEDARRDDNNTGQTEADSETAEAGVQTEEDVFPADQGCYLIQNQLGPELIITIVAKERDWQESFQIAADQELPYCISPGGYTVFIDAPPPWADLEDTLNVAAGDRYFWPIRAGQ